MAPKVAINVRKICTKNSVCISALMLNEIIINGTKEVFWEKMS